MIARARPALERDAGKIGLYRSRTPAMARAAVMETDWEEGGCWLVLCTVQCSAVQCSVV